jgi:hypothetical protein
MARQGCAMLGEPGKQFSLTRAALNTRAQKQFFSQTAPTENHFRS